MARRPRGVKLRRSSLGPRFDNYAMALQAALDGLGVAIGLRPYVEDDIAIRPAGRAVRARRSQGAAPGIWFIARFARTIPVLVAFRDWLGENFRAGEGAR